MSAASTAAAWRERAAAAERPAASFVGGRWTEEGAEASLAVVGPADGTVVAELAAASGATVDAAVAAARRAWEGGWSRAAPADRKRLLFAFADEVARRRDDLAALMTLETGKPISDALGEVDGTAAALRFYGEAVDKVYGQIAPTDPSSLALVTREPMGVVAAVTPWNYPLLMATWKVAPALAAGNAVVLKPAEQAPLACLQLGAIAAAAGLPDGVLNVVAGVGEVAGAALGLHEDVDAVTFTGSTAVGKLFLRYAGESNMKAVSLECGGKSPHIVLPGAPLEEAAQAVAAGVFENAGQMCNAGARLIADAAVHDALVEAVGREAAGWQPGDPFDPATRMGPLVDAEQLARVRGYVDTGVREGADVAAGGTTARDETGGFFFAPTVLAGASNDMTVAREEIFGPVLTVIRTEGAEEAVAVANDTPYGLAAGVWTSDLRTAHRIARELRAGAVYVNCFNRGELSVPFGGFKQSGLDVDKSLLALQKYTRVKATWIGLEGA